MQPLIRWINALSQMLLGVRILNLFRQVSQSQLALRQVDLFAQKRQFIRAFVTAEEVIARWNLVPSWTEQQTRRWLMARSLEHVGQRMKEWEFLAEQEYRAALERSHWLATEGRFQEAIDLLEPVHRQASSSKLMSRSINQAWIDTLHSVIAGRKSFYLGLFAEQLKQWEVAKEHYQKAMSLSPHWRSESQLRLAWIDAQSAHTRQHIDQPSSLDVELWKRQNWQEIVEVTESSWLNHLSISTLHNWAVATYYRALNSKSYWEEAIVALSTALANLHHDPSIQNIPWLAGQTVDLSELYAQLKENLEELINSIEQTQPTEWSQIQLLYRLEKTALELIGYPATKGLRVKGLFLTPGCYQRYRHKLKNAQFPGSLVWALYTDWWQSILACLEGNTFQALQLKPPHEPTSEAEKFAQSFLNYHEGCYYLQISPHGNPRWRLAIKPLQQAKSVIQASSVWCIELDHLFEIHFKAVWNTSDRPEFTQFWYDLLASPLAKSYLDSSR